MNPRNRKGAMHFSALGLGALLFAGDATAPLRREYSPYRETTNNGKTSGKRRKKPRVSNPASHHHARFLKRARKPKKGGVMKKDRRRQITVPAFCSTFKTVEYLLVGASAWAAVTLAITPTLLRQKPPPFYAALNGDFPRWQIGALLLLVVFIHAVALRAAPCRPFCLNEIENCRRVRAAARKVCAAAKRRAAGGSWSLVFSDGVLRRAGGRRRGDAGVWVVPDVCGVRVWCQLLFGQRTRAP